MTEVHLINTRNHRGEAIGALYQPGEDAVAYSSSTIFDETDETEWSDYSGAFTGKEWLDAVGMLYLSPDDFKGATSWGNDKTPDEFARMVATFAGSTDYAQLFLDSFSVIENGESSRREERIVRKSPGQQALLAIARSRPSELARMSPREFEVLVSATLTEFGFSRVRLNRYSKDAGIDIFAVMASGSRTEQDETVIVEVKHSKRPVGLAVLDRLNGVRDRDNADRAMLVVSSRVTSAALEMYSASSNYVAAHTIRELFARLADSPNWSVSPRGLWTASE